MSSGYGAIGAMIASEKVIEPFLRPGVAFPHGYTFGGHPVAAAVAWPTWTSSSASGSTSTCATTRLRSGRPSSKLLDLPIVGDVRGDGYF